MDMDMNAPLCYRMLELTLSSYSERRIRNAITYGQSTINGNKHPTIFANVNKLKMAESEQKEDVKFLVSLLNCWRDTGSNS
jgi:hypothetical protein